MTIATTSPPRPSRLTADQFLEFLKTRPDRERWDLIEGVAAMMNPPSLAHQQICLNLTSLLTATFSIGGRDLRVLYEVAVRTPGVTDFQPRPDIVVFPGVADTAYFTEKYNLVVEVLSPTNTEREIERKLSYYKRAPDCLYVLVVDSRRHLVQLHARADEWQSRWISEPGAAIELPEFGFRCRLGDLYRHTHLDPTRKR
jgi:Uma2 family endonuclease